MKFSPLNKLPAYKALSETILSEIMAGRVRQGDLLPTEFELCEQFNVNRSTVREGIRLLEEAGVLTRGRAKRFTITKPTQNQISVQLQRAMVMREVTFGELGEAVLTIEPPMARLAAERRNMQLIGRIEANFARTEDALAAGRSLTELDIEFHNLIADAAGNSALTLAREPLVQLFYPAYDAVFAAVPNAGDRLLVAHHNILSSLRVGDLDATESWTRKHIRDFRRGLDVANIDSRAPIKLDAFPRVELGDAEK